MKNLFVLAILLLVCTLLGFSQNKPVALDLKGIQYAFDRATAPEFTSLSNIYVVFYGAGKSGWDSVNKRSYPQEPRRVFSKIYWLRDLPEGYNWNSPSLAPYQMQPLFFEYLMKSYGFTKANHQVGYIVNPRLSKLEKELGEMIQYMSSSDKVVPDKDFKFVFRDKSYSDPYFFEYKGD